MSSSAMASFSSSTNKGPNNFAHSYDDLSSDFFDQFLTFDPVEIPVDIKSPDYSILPATFDDGPIDGELSGGSSSFPEDDPKDFFDAQGELSALQRDPASFNQDVGNYFYAEASGRAAVSDPELLSLRNITLDSPQIPTHPRTSPSSPSSNSRSFLLRKNRLTESISRTFKRATGTIDRTLLRTPIKKSTSSKMLRTAHSNNSEEWERKLNDEATKFDFNLDHNPLPASPPSSGKISDASDTSENNGHRTDIFAHSTNIQTTPIMGYDTPMATPTLEQHQTPRTTYHAATSSSPFPITPRTHNASGSWSQMPSSAGFNSHPYGSSSSHVFDEADGPVWWNHAATAPMAQPSPSGYRTNPQRATKSLVAMQLQNDLAFSAHSLAFDPLNMSGGLMIQMPQSTGSHGRYAMEGTSPIQRQGYFTPQSPSMPRHHHRAEQQRERQQQHHYHARARHTQPYPHPHPHSHSHHQPQSSPMRKSRSRTHVSDTDSCPSPSLQARKRKNARAKKTAGTGGNGAVDFVNFTPSDSRKILTGVAPSGSSKTKARREKEALEKRRKLSQAAFRAVRDAGGDVESLVEQGLLC